MLLKNTKPKGGGVVLTGVQPKVYEVFQLLGFTKFFEFCDSIKKYVAFYGALEVVDKPKFPLSLQCPSCSKKLKTPKSGRFRCPNCKKIISINKDTNIRIE